jgi:hypothetical protein
MEFPPRRDDLSVMTEPRDLSFLPSVSSIEKEAQSKTPPGPLPEPFVFGTLSVLRAPWTTVTARNRAFTRAPTAQVGSGLFEIDASTRLAARMARDGAKNRKPSQLTTLFTPSDPTTTTTTTSAFATGGDPMAEALHLAESRRLLLSSAVTPSSLMPARFGVPLFQVLEPEYDWEGGVDAKVCNRDPQLRPLWPLCDPLQFAVSPLVLNLSAVNPPIEPFYGTLALFDVASGTRLSENFYFDANQDEVRAMVAAAGPVPPPLKQHALFTLGQNPMPQDVHLVLRVDKVLQGDADPAIDLYAAKADDKARDKARDAAKDFCKRLGGFRQPVAWAAVRVFKDREPGSSSSDLPPFALGSVVSFDHLYAQRAPLSDAALCEAIEASKDPKKRGKVLPGCCILNACLVETDPETRARTAVERAEDKRAGTKDTFDMINDKFQELAEFPKAVDCRASTAAARPYASFVNDLYVYPDSANLSSLKTGIGKSRNVTVRVELRSADDAADASVVTAVYSQLEDELVASAVTQVSYHSKTPTFQDEVRVRLPLALTAQHHLVFTFWHVPCQVKGTEEEAALRPIGFSYLPLFPHLPVEERSLPVFFKMEPGYLSQQRDQSGRDKDAVEGGKPVFKLKLRLNSAIFPRDERLTSFLRMAYPAAGAVPSAAAAAAAPAAVADAVADPTPAATSTTDGEQPQPQPQPQTTPAELQPSPSAKAAPQYTDLFDALRGVRAQDLVRHLHVVVHRLLELLCDPTWKTKKVVFACLVHVADVVSREVRDPSSQRNSLLASLVEFYTPTEAMVRDNPLHSAICEVWCQSLAADSDQQVAQGSLNHAWVFFELIAKSLAILTYSTGVQTTPDDLHAPFLLEVKALVQTVTGEVKRKRMPQAIVKSLNRFLARFFVDLFGLLPRAYVVHTLIANYLEQLQGNDPECIEFRFDMYRIVADFEFFPALNSPPSTPDFLAALEQQQQLAAPSPAPQSMSVTVSDPSAAAAASTAAASLQSFSAPVVLGIAAKRHLLIAALIGELRDGLASKSGTLLFSSVSTIRSLLTKHDHDLVLVDHRPRLAAMYFPLVIVVVDGLSTWGMGSTKGATERRMVLSCLAWVLDSADRASLRTYLKRETEPRLIRFLALLRDIIVEWRYEPKRQVEMSSAIKAHTTKNLLEEMYANRGATASLRIRGGRKATISPQAAQALIDGGGGGGGGGSGLGGRDSMAAQPSSSTLLLPGSAATMGRFRGSTALIASRNSTAVGNDGGGDVSGPSLYSTASASALPSSSSSSSSSGGINSGADLPAAATEDAEAAQKFEAQASIAHARVVLSVLQDLLDDLGWRLDSVPLTRAWSKKKKDPAHAVESELLSPVFALLLSLVESNQSTDHVSIVYAVLDRFVAAHATVLFARGRTALTTEFTGRLCQVVFRHMMATLPSVRAEAMRLALRLLRCNWECEGSLAPCQLQMTVALSEVVSSAAGGGPLEDSFGCVIARCQAQPAGLGLGPEFDLAVEQFFVRMLKNLEDSLCAERVADSDAELLADLYCRISLGYHDAPVLRNNWMRKVAAHHRARGNHVEAGTCYLFCASFIARYRGFDVPTSSSLLPFNIFPDVPCVHGIGHDANHQEIQFTEELLLDTLGDAIRDFRDGEIYEYACEVYKVVIQVHERARRFDKAADAHRELTSLFETVQRANAAKSSSRFLGMFYRVGFYGPRFAKEGLHGREFVYKEPKLTRLAEITDRLKTLYDAKFGVEVTLVGDSKRIDPDSPGTAGELIQVTYVTAEVEGDARVTQVERETNVQRFAFETPFTASGSARGEIGEQFIRKTILTVGRPFPAFTTRQEVIARQEVIVTPIQNAILTLRSRVDKMNQEVVADPLNMKALQSLLTGSVLAQVNSGPSDIFYTFLDNPGDKYPRDEVEELREVMFDFLKACKALLHINKNHKAPEQEDFHFELTRGYQSLVDLISANLASPGRNVAVELTV